MKHMLLFLSALGSLASCNDPANTDNVSASTDDSVAVANSANTIDLSQFDMPLIVNVPENGTTPVAVMNAEMGQVEVRAGDHFGIAITEMQPDFARLKADLERDMLLKNTIVRETPGLVLYRSEYPDAAGVFMHFVQVVGSGARTFVVEDLRNGRFNESDAKAMLLAVTAKSAS